MKKLFLITLVIFGVYLNAIEPHFMMDPAISPDGEEVCFVFHDQLWTVDWDGGEAKSLTIVDRGVSSPQYSPDGEWIAYMTSREGYQSIYKIASDGGTAIQVSTEDFSLCDWFPDGRSLLVTRYQERYRTEYFQLFFDGSFKKLGSFSDSFSSLNREGDKIIFCRRGYPYRESYTGSANGDLWIYDIAKEKYIRLTESDLTERYPQFSMINDCIYFGASDGEVFQLFKVTGYNFDEREQLTNFKTWSLRDLDVAHKNDRIVYEYFDNLGKYDPETGKSSIIEIEIKQDILENTIQEEDFANRGEIFDVSKDGKLLVFSWKYDLFAMPVKGGDVKQITYDQKGIEDLVILDDSKTVIFTQYENGSPQPFRVTINNIEDIEKIKWKDDRYVEYVSKQNGRLHIGYSTDDSRAYRVARGDSLGNNLKIIDTGERMDFVSISPDEKYLIYSVTDFQIWNRELKIYDMEKKESISLLKKTGWLSSFQWGKDNESAFFSLSGDIYRLDLKPKDEFYYAEKDNWEEILKKDTEKKKDDGESDKSEEKDDESLEIKFDNLDDRIEKIVGKDGTNYVVHLTDDMIYYINRNKDVSTLRKVKYNGDEDKEIYEIGTDIGNVICRNDNWYFQMKNSLYSMPLNGSKAEMIKNKFSYEYDRHELNKSIFDQVWKRFGRGFYDPDMHGLNWDKIYKKYSEFLPFAYEPGILGNIVDEMIGEVNASHTGFYPRRDKHNKYISKAYLGATFDMADFPSKGIRFDKLYRTGSLALDHDVKPGDILMEIDGEKVGKDLPLDSLLRGKAGEKIELVIDTGDSLKTIQVKGINSNNNYNLWYNDWVESRRDKVDRLTNGRVGYCHIKGMNTSSYDKFEDELFGLNFDKEALIIDIRFNGGGRTHDMILETLTKKQYGWSSSRYGDAEKHPTPGDIWQKPIVLLIDEDSFSDAEIFPILFKHLKLGKVIGMPTSGSVIGTGHINFMDGSSMRMPSSGWFEEDLTNMEGRGASPDIYVPMNPEDYINDNDKQLQRGIEELLKELN